MSSISAKKQDPDIFGQQDWPNSDTQLFFCSNVHLSNLVLGVVDLLWLVGAYFMPFSPWILSDAKGQQVDMMSPEVVEQSLGGQIDCFEVM